MTVLRFILGDHLTRSVTALADIDPARDVVLMAEVAEEAKYVRHHKQKIAFILSAMRHFAQELRTGGLNVDYVKLDDPANTGTFTGEVERALRRHCAAKVVVTEPGEWRVLEAMQSWRRFGVPVEVRQDDRFFATQARFAQWASGRMAYRMEFFYREMRRESGLLMNGDAPAGGKWNFDAQNRKKLPKEAEVPQRQRFLPDSITAEVLALVRRRFADHFGDLEPFGWAVTRGQALESLEDFIANGLPRFGDYQDALKQGEPFLYHAVISPYCARSEAEYRAGRAPLNAVEGFIRQILGWREYVRGIYWLCMPEYASSNALEAQRPLPSLYWTGDTEMNCLRQVIAGTRRHAYSHHIQRLMVTGNFALLAGIRPQDVCEWYLAVYADAFEWVELPNTLGMSQFADGGLLASKPYAASGAYIDRMSDFCGNCSYDVHQKTGSKACPFNFLYWAFLIRNEKRLRANPRLSMPYRYITALPSEQRAAILNEATEFIAGLS